ncbi:hypothetical protein HPP92_017309 [Vanilla planifolia]|uniref:Uncharacterized protein n=1 Tax=Vanilla planifolia TaxID=51239 RepID=A0A835UQG3_VANPL|nr:hypothetical protein HPP92_017309 [Vanilla planifolia]
MSHYEGSDIDEVIDEYEMGDMDDGVEEFHVRRADDSESDEEEYERTIGRITDTTAVQARNGKDIQGIPWEGLNITRSQYRQTRLEQYKNYENIPNSGEASKKGCKPIEKGGNYYEFSRNSRSVKSTILHFQLRNLVWATSKHDVYLMSHYSVIHWSSLTCGKREIMNVSGHVAPCEKHPGSLLEGFSQTQVSTLAVKDKLLVAGGFQGNSSANGAVHFMASNNDGGVRDYDMEKFQLSKHFRFNWPVNHTALSPNGKLLVVVGDSAEAMLLDSQTGKPIQNLQGHVDYSFASAWHPDGRTFATGNQDKTCRLWDVRNLSSSIAAFRGNLGAIRSIRFTSDGQFMAMAEPADFVHIFDVGSGYNKRQELDFFGEISGMSFSPDTESLFVGIWDRTYGSLLQYRRRHSYSYLDLLF